MTADNNHRHIINFIEENYEPVEDKPGYFWLSKRHFRIIHIETLTKELEAVNYRKESEENE